MGGLNMIGRQVLVMYLLILDGNSMVNWVTNTCLNAGDFEAGARARAGVNALKSDDHEADRGAISLGRYSHISDRSPSCIFYA
jgi:hypothetical protein